MAGYWLGVGYRVWVAAQPRLALLTQLAAHAPETASDATKRETLRQLTALNPGELFNHAKLMQAQHNLATSGLVDPAKVDTIPRPDLANGKANSNFAVMKK